MIRIYASLIKKGIIRLEDVPQDIREQVERELNK